MDWLEAVPADVEVQDVHQGFGRGDLDELAFAAHRIPPVEGGQDIDRGLLAADVGGQPGAGAHGVAALAAPGALVRRKAGVVDPGVGRSGEGVQHPLAVFGDFILHGTPLAPLPHPAVDQPGFDLGQLPVADAQGVHIARGPGLDDDIHRRGHLLVDFPAFLGLQVQGDGFGVAELVEEVQAAGLAGDIVLQHVLFPAEGGELPQGVAPGRLNMNHFGALFAQQAGGKHSAYVPDAVAEHPEALQGFRFIKDKIQPQVVFQEFAEFLRLALGIDIVHHPFRRRRRSDGPGPDIRPHEGQSIGSAVDFNVAFFFRHFLTSHIWRHRSSLC